MSTEDNKATVRPLFEEVLNQGNFAVFDELYASNFIFHEPNFPQVRTREDDKRWLSESRSAFPDVHFTIDDLIAEGDQVAVRFTSRGTNAVDIVAPMPHPATGKQFIATGSSSPASPTTSSWKSGTRWIGSACSNNLA